MVMGLIGVTGDRVLVDDDGWGDGFMGDKLVGDVTVRADRLSESDEERSMPWAGLPGWPVAAW